ncbi:MAG: hypothetical protein P1V20_26530 [Verrucomicrobiales bacterium]|nr:hypothetical protein [Verrucomicrobiales bacterium]
MVACQPKETWRGGTSALVFQARSLWDHPHIFERLIKEYCEISERKIIHPWEFTVSLVALGVYAIRNLKECQAICATLGKASLYWVFLSEGHRYGLDNLNARSRVIKTNLETLKQYVDSEGSFEDETALQRYRFYFEERDLAETLKPEERNFFFAGEHKKNETLRIAVCISGQLRGFKKASETWEVLGFGNHQVDYYLHSWVNIGSKALIPQHVSRLLSPKVTEVMKRLIHEIGVEQWRQEYRGFINSFKRDREATESELCEVLPFRKIVLEEDRSPPFSQMSNVEKMYYKVSACWELIDDPSAYDLVIRIRPDKIIKSACVDWSSVVSYAKKLKAVFTDFGVELFPGLGLIVGDQFAVSTPKLMEVYSNTYYEVENGRQNILDKGYFPHKNFAHCFLQNGLNAVAFPGVKFGPMMNADIPSLETQMNALRKDADGRWNSWDLELKRALETDVAANQANQLQ